MALLCSILLAASPFGEPPPAAGFLCKNASSDWPLPCRRASDAIEHYHVAQPGTPSSAAFPISAWWGPTGYSESRESKDPKPTEEFLAYAAANFNNVMVSDRGSEHCDNSNASAGWQASWKSIQAQIALANKHNMSSLVDSYRCLPWGPPTNIGGESQGRTAGFVNGQLNHKITLPEVQWLANLLVDLPGAAGILITDDGVDLARNEIEEVQWMRANTPSLFPWINQCGDGSEWLARAGTPYSMPELYSVNGETANATTMAQAQLGGYDAWIGKSQRFGLTHWPLVGIGDGGDIKVINSTSLVRFQAYSAVAYGAKGIMWYCWGNAVWDFGGASSGIGPTAIYPVVTEVNGRLGKQWAAEIAVHRQWQGVFSTGWGVPGGEQALHDPYGNILPTSKGSVLAPKAGALIEAMGEDLLVGVMTTAGPLAAASSILLVVVDKRVSDGLAPAAARTASLKLSGSNSVRVLPSATSTTSYDPASRTLTITGLTGGDAVALVLEGGGADASAAAAATHQWRFSTTRPAMSSIWTTQHQYYNGAYKNRRATTFILGSTELLSTEEAVTAAAESGFNLVSTAETDKEAVLQAGLRQGVGVVVMLSSPQTAEIQSAIGCHPNWAGFVLADAADVSSQDGPTVARLKTLRDGILQQSPHAYGILSAQPALEVLRVSNATGLPIVALSLPLLPMAASVADAALASVRELGSLRSALPASLDMPHAAPSQTAFLTTVDPCAGTAGLARLQAYAALLMGTAGVIHRTALCAASGGSQGGGGTAATALRAAAGEDRRAIVTAVNSNLAQWEGRLQPSVVRLTSIAQSVSTPAAGLWALPTGVTRGGTRTPLIRELGEGLVVGYLESLGPGGVINASKAPPLLLLIDSRTENGPRKNASLVLGPTVIGWTPFVGDVESGFASCAKFVLGNEPQPSLLPGEALLIGLTVQEPAGGGGADAGGRARLWARSGGEF